MLDVMPRAALLTATSVEGGVGVGSRVTAISLRSVALRGSACGWAQGLHCPLGDCTEVPGANPARGVHSLCQHPTWQSTQLDRPWGSNGRKLP